MTGSQPTDVAGFSVPGRSRGLLDVFGYRYLLRLLVRKGILTRYHGSVLGWTWSYVKPAAQFIVFYLVFGIFLDLNRGIPGFPVYLFSGIIVINLFNEAFSNATKSIVDNAPLVKKIFLPRELFPVATVIVAFVHFLPQVLILLLVCLWVGWAPTWIGIAGILLGALIVVIISTGLGLLFGAVNVSFRDAQNFVELVLLFATWTSPVLYSWTMVRDTVPAWVLEIYMLNPLTAAVELFHEGFWLPTISEAVERPDSLWLNAFLALGLAIVLLFVGQFAFRRLEGRFAQDL
ncbi:ABC transporter permease [Agromyces subbeticus]|uniref:ABC transporter permease n=1 Tax=Agromyces subbeticus TaxID=293890 RepID=UPI0003B61918|nr:ABC transporter permease [Agromyces subbeticus]